MHFFLEQTDKRTCELYCVANTNIWYLILIKKYAQTDEILILTYSNKIERKSHFLTINLINYSI